MKADACQQPSRRVSQTLLKQLSRVARMHQIRVLRGNPAGIAKLIVSKQRASVWQSWNNGANRRLRRSEVNDCAMVTIVGLT